MHLTLAGPVSGSQRELFAGAEWESAPAVPWELVWGDSAVPALALSLDAGSGQRTNIFPRKNNCCSPPAPQHPSFHLFIVASPTKLTIIRNNMILVCGWIIFNNI